MMASVHHDQAISASAAAAWSALREFHSAHRLFSPILADGSGEGEFRTVTFADGLVVRERLIDRDDSRRRLCYSVQGDLFEHHSAAMEIRPGEGESCRFLWVSDFLPNDRSEMVRSLMIAGSAALAANIERLVAPAGPP